MSFRAHRLPTSILRPVRHRRGCERRGSRRAAVRRGPSPGAAHALPDDPRSLGDPAGGAAGCRRTRGNLLGMRQGKIGRKRDCVPRPVRLAPARRAAGVGREDGGKRRTHHPRRAVRPWSPCTAASRPSPRATLAAALAFGGVGPAPARAADPLARTRALRTVAPAAARDFPKGDEGYHTYAEIVAEVKATAAAHPEIVRRFSIGRSYQKRDLVAVEITSADLPAAEKPAILVDGGIHALEHFGPEAALAVMHWLVDGYGTDARITRLVRDPFGLHRLRGQPRRQRIRHRRRELPLVAEEPPAERGNQRDRHRSQPQLRLALGLLRQDQPQPRVVVLHRRPRLLGAGDAGDPRFRRVAGDRRAPADPRLPLVPHGRPKGPLADGLDDDSPRPAG